MKASTRQLTPAIHRNVLFGIKDSKGREIGIDISTCTIEVFELTDAQSSVGFYSCFDELGEFISVCMTATRNGNSYGACQPRSYFKTQAEADVAIEKRIKSTRARYAKAAR